MVSACDLRDMVGSNSAEIIFHTISLTFPGLSVNGTWRCLVTAASNLLEKSMKARLYKFLPTKH